MRIQAIIIFAATGTLARAKPHPHVHHHAHEISKRHGRPDNVVYAPAAIETKIVFELDHHSISEQEVRQGIANGTLMWGDDGILSTSTRLAVTRPTTQPEPEDMHEPVTEGDPDDPSKSKPSKPSAQKPSSTLTSSSPTPYLDTSSRAWADLVDKDGHCRSCDEEFPNGKISCSEFPYGYGALPISHEGLGGWSGIQDPHYRGVDGFDDIATVTKSSCEGSTCCTPGSFCSYGCPNPYLKLSFPKTQGRTGQTVGGLYCNDQGFLEMADGALGKTLCGKGSKSMTVKVQNKLSKSVSICRTDYPGKLCDLFCSQNLTFTQELRL